MKHIGIRFGLLASLLVHLVFVLSSLSLSKFFTPPQATKAERIEISLLESEQFEAAPPPPAKQIVDQSEKAINDEVDPQAKYLSRNNQRVIDQTIAQKVGEFNNGSGSPVSEEVASSQKQKMEKFLPKMDITRIVDRKLASEKEAQLFEQGQPVALQKEMKSQQSQEVADAKEQKAGSGPSQTLDYIKELEPGLETLLSTQEFKFYTFYSRIRSQLNQHWSPMVQTKMSDIYRSGRSVASEADRVTKVLFILNPSGELVKVQVIGRSGLRELDETAAKALQSAAPFLNPPKGMVDETGYIKILWDFVVDV